MKTREWRKKLLSVTALLRRNVETINERCCTPLYSPGCTAFGPQLHCIWPTGTPGRAGLGLLVKRDVDKPTMGQYVLYRLQSENSCWFCLVSVRRRLVGFSSVSLGWDKPMEKEWRGWQADKRVSLESMAIMLTSCRKQPEAEITSSLLPSSTLTEELKSLLCYLSLLFTICEFY